MRARTSWIAALAIAFLLGLAARPWLAPSARRAGAASAPPRAPGDVNADGSLDISDPVYLLRHLFLNGPPPADCAATGPVSVAIVVRHAEKGAGADPPLTPEGQARAERLAAMLASLPIDHLIASDLLRTRQTLEPTAANHGDQAIERIAEPEAVAARILASPPGSVSVVAHHSFTLDAILRGLGLEDTAGLSFTFDNFFVVLLPPAAAPQLLHLRY